MHPLVRALLSSWEWRFEIVIVLLAFGLLYTLGWVRLRRRSSGGGLATGARLAAYLGGLFVLAAALMSPIDKLGGQLFFMHMTQHMLTIMVAAPLLLLGNPYPFIVWGLPRPGRKVMTGLFRSDSSFRRLMAAATKPIFAWLVFITVYLGWHDANLYGLALRNDTVHDFQHITFFLAAMLFWWPVIGAAPHIHGRFPAFGRMAYLIGAIPPAMFVGVSIAYSSTVIYSYYASVPRIWGVSLMEDQMLGGVIMWIPGSMMFIMAALIVLARMFGGSDVVPLQPGDWEDESTLIMPGLEHRALQNKWRRLHTDDRPAAGVR
ncbi:MAG: cytochrome c oxidase assembly protein [Caldilineaceae bacterium]